MNFLNKIILALFIIMGALNATVYSDGEQQNISQWRNYSNNSQITKNIISQNGTLEFKKEGLFILGGKASDKKHRWNNKTQKTISWKMKFNKRYYIYVYIETTGKDIHRIRYSSSSQNKINHSEIRIPLGKKSDDGEWVNVTQNIEEDLHQFRPNDSIVAVHGILVQTTLRSNSDFAYMDEIQLTGEVNDNDPEDDNNDNNNSNNNVDTIAPIIHLQGESTVTINVGDAYQDEGATASDNQDGDISNKIIVKNPVDTNLAGRYIITYNVKDTQKNKANEVQRTVIVQKREDTPDNHQKATLFVAPSGDDQNSGKDTQHPLKTIGQAIKIAGEGDVISIFGGTYREGLLTLKHSNITFQNYLNQKVIIKGSMKVTAWEHYQDNIWKLASKNQDQSGLNRSVHYQQVFYADGKQLQMIGYPNYKVGGETSIWKIKKRYIKIKENANNPFGMSEGTFYVKKDGNEFDLYVWLPNGKKPTDADVVMEVSDKSYLINAKTFKNITFRGISFMHTAAQSKASYPHYQGGYALRVGEGGRIENCEFAYTDFAGLNLGKGYAPKGTNMHQHVSNSKFHHNGAVGVTATTGGFLIENSEFYENARRPFIQYWHTGAIKVSSKGWGEIKNNHIYDERAQGIWFDNCSSGQPILIHHNYIDGTGNAYNNPLRQLKLRGHAIFFEQSKNIKIYNNIVNKAIQRGIYVSASTDVVVSNNLVRQSNLEQLAIRYREDKKPGAKNIKVLNNIFIDKRGKYDMKAFYESKPNSKFDKNNEFSNNIIYNSDGKYRADFATAHWRLEDNLLDVDPMLTTNANADLSKWSLSSNSSAINQATTYPFIKDDYRHKNRDASPDIGSFEY